MARFWSDVWPIRFAGREWPLHRLAQVPAAWAPRVDAYEKEGRLIVQAELPGMKKEDIQVALDQNDLIIKGEHKTESEVKAEDYYRCERSYGSFFRRMPLPFTAKAENIKAKYTDGVLQITIPKPTPEREEVKSQQIPIAA
ncbi:MAG: Hsp20/alpha crystallin family protein [Chloroflexi bacterium]|nr:Hsp20/alpha crystallin family protein [Chloroflexota bacterium]